MFSMQDSKLKKLSEILGNKTCKKILDFLSEIKEASEKDIADSLKSPINTIEYNLKKLVDAGLVEKTKNFFWSKKGKKIPMYKISNKSIIISPKTKIISETKKILPVALLSGIAGLVVRKFYLASKEVSREISQKGSDFVTSVAVPETFSANSETAIQASSPVWIWLLGGLIAGLILFFLINTIVRRPKNG